MLGKCLTRLLALLLAASLVLPVLAKPVSKRLTLDRPAKFGRLEVTAGEYRLVLDGNKVVVHRGKEVLGEVEGGWVERSVKPRFNSVLLGPDREVQEIRFANETRVFVLKTP